jgi:transposase InsO family protein
MLLARRWILIKPSSRAAPTRTRNRCRSGIIGVEFHLIARGETNKKELKVAVATFELVHRREAERPNSIWQADYTPLDILLVRPDGRNAKPWLTTVIDNYSRAIAGYFLSFEDPSVLHTSLALRQAIWRKQEPRWIVCVYPPIQL